MATSLFRSGASWNGHDPFIKERLFGLANPEGSHEEDVKRVLVAARARRRRIRSCGGCTATRRPSSRTKNSWPRTLAAAGWTPVLELVDTGVLDENRFFDVEIVRRSPRR